MSQYSRMRTFFLYITSVAFSSVSIKRVILQKKIETAFCNALQKHVTIFFVILSRSYDLIVYTNLITKT